MYTIGEEAYHAKIEDVILEEFLDAFVQFESDEFGADLVGAALGRSGGSASASAATPSPRARHSGSSACHRVLTLIHRRAVVVHVSEVRAQSVHRSPQHRSGPARSQCPTEAPPTCTAPYIATWSLFFDRRSGSVHPPDPSKCCPDSSSGRSALNYSSLLDQRSCSAL